MKDVGDVKGYWATILPESPFSLSPVTEKSLFLFIYERILKLQEPKFYYCFQFLATQILTDIDVFLTDRFHRQSVLIDNPDYLSGNWSHPEKGSQTVVHT